MTEFYAYRRSSRSKVVWLCAAAAAAVMIYGITYDVPNIIGLVLVFIFVVIGWQLMANNVRGIRVDTENLILNAWREPRLIALDDIAYLRAEHWTDDPGISIVYKDGTEERTNPRDMPPLSELTEVMAMRGIRIKDPVV